MIRLALALTLMLGAAQARAEVNIQKVTSPGGITAWLVEEHSIPFTALEIRFRGGTAMDRPGKRGAVNLMTGLLEEGAGDMNAQEFAAARDALAAKFEFDAYRDAISVSAKFLSENRDEAVALLRDALVDPTFPEAAVDRVREQVLSIIASEENDPASIAWRSFNALAFGDHPYGSDGNGTVESVSALTRADIVQAHDDTLVKDRVFIGAAGDITPEALGRLLDKLLGDLPQSGAPLPGEARYQLEPGITEIELDTPQSTILFGHEGIPRDDPDFFAAYIANEIFGGSGFNSRLMEEVRKERGLTYSIATWLQPMQHAELLMGQAATANERAGRSVEVIAEEWAKIAKGVTGEELEAAKTYLTGAYPLRFDGNARISRIMVGMQLQDLPIDYVNTRNDRINAVTLEDIHKVTERIYRPEDLHFVVVGQPEGLPEES